MVGAMAAGAGAGGASPGAGAAPRGAGDMLNAIDQDRIAEAVTKAEEGTSGEIVCVLAAEVSHYPEVALGWAAVAALVVPPLALVLGARPLAMAADAGFWMAAQAGALEGELVLALLLYALLQTVLFILVFA